MVAANGKVLELFTKQSRFQNVSSLSLYFSGNTGDIDITKIYDLWFPTRYPS